MVTDSDVLPPNVEMVVGADVSSRNDEITGTYKTDFLGYGKQIYCHAKSIFQI